MKMILTDAEVTHMRLTLAWMRVEYCLDEDMQRGSLSAIKTLMDAGVISQNEADSAIAKRADQIKQVPKYVRHGIKILTKALRIHDGVKGEILDVHPMREVLELEDQSGRAAQSGITPPNTVGQATCKNDGSALRLAKRFHEAYERLAPKFGYQTRNDTREFDQASDNGRLMIAVCAEILASPLSDVRATVGEEMRAKFTTWASEIDPVSGYKRGSVISRGIQMEAFEAGFRAADKGEASHTDQPFERVPQHAYDPGYGPVPPIPKVVPLHGRNDACCGKPTECDKDCYLRREQ